LTKCDFWKKGKLWKNVFILLFSHLSLRLMFSRNKSPNFSGMFQKYKLASTFIRKIIVKNGNLINWKVQKEKAIFGRIFIETNLWLWKTWYSKIWCLFHVSVCPPVLGHPLLTKLWKIEPRFASGVFIFPIFIHKTQRQARY
jgi:hypothetical protein